MSVLNLNSLGLQNGAIGDNFNDPRGDCFHSGVDYTTGGAATSFRAAVYGVVVDPVGGQWGTISVRPFGSTDVIQYLHCSSIDVASGEIVAPWTILGTTGDVCPPGTCNGVHLHLQAVSADGTPTYDCWSRNYLNPNSWTYANPLVGTWSRHFTEMGTGNGYSYWITDQTVVIATDVLPAPFSLVDDITVYLRSPSGITCELIIVSRYTLTFQGYDKNAVRVRAVPAGATLTQVGGTGDCSGLRVTQIARDGTLALDDRRLRVGGSFGDWEAISAALVAARCRTRSRVVRALPRPPVRGHSVRYGSSRVG